MQYSLLFYSTPEEFTQRDDPEGHKKFRAGFVPYMKALQDAGIVVAGAGLQKPGTATSIRLGRDGGQHMQDGPFADTKEQLAGFFIIEVPDMDAALKFYQEVFHWQPGESMDMGPMGKYQIFNRPHGQIGGMMNKPKEMASVPPNWQIYFRVPDVDAAVERVKAAGGKILNGPMDVPDGDRVLNAMDPQGAAFGLHSKKAK